MLSAVSRELGDLLKNYVYKFNFLTDVSITLHCDWSPSLNRYTVRVDAPAELTAEESTLSRLTNHQCENCPLDPAMHSECPLAASVTPVFSAFKEYDSFDSVTVGVWSSGRYIESATTVQKGLSSLTGLLMSCSGCPHFNFLKPVAAHHLPFLEQAESMQRLLGTLLISEVINGRTVSKDKIEGIIDDKFSNLSEVNRGVAIRFRSIPGSDALINAVIVLDSVAKMMDFVTSPDSELGEIFSGST